MTHTLLFDPLAGADDMEAIVIRDTQRTYYRTRASRHYGSIVTADTVGYPFPCA